MGRIQQLELKKEIYFRKIKPRTPRVLDMRFLSNVVLGNKRGKRTCNLFIVSVISYFTFFMLLMKQSVLATHAFRTLVVDRAISRKRFHLDMPSTERKVAVVTGVTGQDGSYLSEFLLAKGYLVHGLIRPSSTSHASRIQHIIDDPDFKGKFFLHEADLIDERSLTRIIAAVRPTEIYNFAAQSHVAVSGSILVIMSL